MNKKLNFTSFLRKIPFVRILIPFVLGVVAELYWVDIAVYPVLIVAAALLFLLGHLIKKQEEKYSSRWISGLSYSLLFMGFGMLFTTSDGVAGQPHEILVFSDDRTYLVEVTDVPRECANSIECVSNVYEIKDSSVSTNEKSKMAKAVIYVAKDSMSRLISMGDILLIDNCRMLNSAADPWDDMPYHKLKGGEFSVFVPKNQWRRIDESKSRNVFEKAEAFRRDIISFYKKKE